MRIPRVPNNQRNSNRFVAAEYLAQQLGAGLALGAHALDPIAML